MHTPNFGDWLREIKFTASAIHLPRRYETNRQEEGRCNRGKRNEKKEKIIAIIMKINQAEVREGG